MTNRLDCIVIGAGPAGMAAASRMGEGGARVLVVEQQPAPGGQIYRRLEANRADAARMRILGSDYAEGISLIERFRRSGATALFDTTVWRVDPSGDVWIRRNGQIERLCARHLIIACGAMERPVPVPGWTLPGTMTIGALQIMMKASGIIPQEDVVLAGTGPLLYLYAAQWLRAGGRGMTVLDTARNVDHLAAATLLPKAVSTGGLDDLRKGLAMMLAVRRSDIAVHTGVSDIEVLGTDRVEGIAFKHRSARRQLPCRHVGLHQGIIAHQQMARSTGCVHAWDEGDAAFRPQRSADGETSLPGIFVAGDAGGIIGARSSWIDGEITALAVLGRLGRAVHAGEADRLRAQLRRSLAIRPFLQAAYAPPKGSLCPPDAVTVCRCENITAGQIRVSVDQGSLGPNQTKAYLRAGMGPCQGRLCGPCVSTIVADRRGGVPVNEAGYYRVRSPLLPIPAGELSRFEAAQE